MRLPLLLALVILQQSYGSDSAEAFKPPDGIPYLHLDLADHLADPQKPLKERIARMNGLFGTQPSNLEELKLVMDGKLHLFGERWILVPPPETYDKIEDSLNRTRSIVAYWTDFCIRHKEALRTATKEPSTLNRLYFVPPGKNAWVELPPETSKAIGEAGLTIWFRVEPTR